MTLTEMQTALKVDLADASWDTDELDRGVTKAVADLSRFLPDEAVYEHTFVLDVTSEAWTSAAAHGTYVELANKPIKYDSETIKSADGVTTYTKDTDYTFDYMNGKITTIDGGSMAVDTAYLATYTKYKEGIDIGSMDANLIRVRRVEYPLSSEGVMNFIPFFIWGNILYIASEQMTDKKHIAIYYDKECTAPTASVDGSFDPILDEVILKGAAAYALMSRGLKAEHDAKTAVGAADTAIATIAKTDAETALDLVGARITAATTALAKITSEATAIGTALDGIAAYLASADAALDKVTTHVGEAGTALDKVAAEVEQAGSDTGEDMENVNTLLTDANSALDKVATQIAAMETSLAELAAMWTDEITFRTAGNAYLESGDDKINLVNVGSRVAEIYGTYAQIQATLARLSENRITAKLTEASTELSSASQYISEANSRANLVSGYISEARERVNQARAYVEEAAGRTGMADRFIGEANGWVALADRKVSNAGARLGLISDYINEANTNLSQANGYIAEANSRLACQELIAKQADTYNAIAVQQMAMAEKYLTEAIERRNEFWSILKDKQQMRREYSLVAQRQSA